MVGAEGNVALSQEELAFQLHSEAGCSVLPTRAGVRQWLPGDAVFDATIMCPTPSNLGITVCEWAFWTCSPGSRPSVGY
jgi:hypothetical protein